MFGAISKGSVDVAFWLGELFYCFKFEYKDRYYKALERLKPYLDERLYDFYYNFGMNSLFLSKKRS